MKLFAGGHMAIKDGRLVAVRDIPAGTVIDHAIGTLISAEQRFAEMAELRLKKPQIKRDEELICVFKPETMESQYDYAYFDTSLAGTRLIEYIVQDAQ